MAFLPAALEKLLGIYLLARITLDIFQFTPGVWLSPLRLGWDLVNNQWNQWVLGYNQDRQRQFLARLNPLLAHWQGMVSALAIAAALVLLALAAALLPQWQRQRRDPASRAYQRFCRALGRRGIPCGAAETAEDFGRRAAALRPDLEAEIRHITRLYLAQRYGPGTTGGLRELQTCVSRFRPATAKLRALSDP